MPTHAFFGHRDTRNQLARAFADRRLPQVLLVTGDPGVGKQRLGLWLAQLVLCQAPGEKPCGNCRACRLVSNLTHPDLHWLVPVPRPKAGDQDKQVDEVREALAEIMELRRRQSIYGEPDGMAIHGVASARLLLRLASLTTVEGGRRVILVGHADRLVPQEASQEAANSLLKFLEEPPASTTVILTATDPTRVLPTIRSRATPVRLGRLSEAELEEALTALAPDLPARERTARIQGAEGSLGRALTPADESAVARSVEDLLEAVRRGGAARFEAALKQGPWAARGDFSALLDGLAVALGEAAGAAAGKANGGVVPQALRDVSDPERMLLALDRVEAARETVQRNVNPQLVLATLTGQLAEVLWA